MKIFKCDVGLSDGYNLIIDGIMHEEKLWVVPQWIEDRKEGTAKPVRIIRFDNFGYQRTQEGRSLYSNILLPITKNDLFGQLPSGIEYVDHPHDLQFDTQEIRKH